MTEAGRTASGKPGSPRDSLSLQAVIEAARRLDELSCARVVALAAEAVHAAQRAGQPVGVTPSAIQLRPDGSVELIAGAASLRYTPPERLRGAAGDRRGEVFALGAVLWEVLAHERLFDGETDEAIRAALGAAFRPPSELNANVPAELDAICKRALARDPADRYPSARVMAAEIDAMLGDAGYPESNEPIAAYVARALAVPEVIDSDPSAREPALADPSLASGPDTASDTLPSVPTLPIEPELPAEPEPPAAVAAPEPPTAAMPPARRPSPERGVPSSTLPLPVTAPPRPVAQTAFRGSSSQQSAPAPAPPSPAAARESPSAAHAPASPSSAAHAPAPLPSTAHTPASPSSAAHPPAPPPAPPPPASVEAISSPGSQPVVAPPAVVEPPRKPPRAAMAPLKAARTEILGSPSLPDKLAPSALLGAQQPGAPRALAATIPGTEAPPSLRPGAAASQPARPLREAPPFAVPQAHPILLDAPVEAARSAPPFKPSSHPHPPSKPSLANAETLATPLPAHLAEPVPQLEMPPGITVAPSLPPAPLQSADRDLDGDHAADPAGVVALPRAERATTARESRDVLAGWAWTTGSLQALDDDTDQAAWAARAGRKRLLIAIGGALGGLLVIAVIAFAAGGSRDRDAEPAATPRPVIAPPSSAAAPPVPPPDPGPAPSTEPAVAPPATASDQGAEPSSAAAAASPPSTDEAAGADTAPSAPDGTQNAAGGAQNAAAAGPAPTTAAASPAPTTAAAASPAPDASAAAPAPKSAVAGPSTVAADITRTAAAATKQPEPPPTATKSATTKATETKPAATKPAETKPTETKPAATKPAETKPTETKAAAKPEPARKTAKPELRRERTAKRPTERAAKPAGKAEPIDPYETPEEKPAIDPAAAYRTGLRQYTGGDTEAALATFRSSLSSNPMYAPTWRGLGLVYEKLGNRTQARSAFQRYLQLAPAAGDADQIRERLERLAP